MDVILGNWNQLLARHRDQKRNNFQGLPVEAVAFWRETVAVASQGSPIERLNRVNRRLNEVPYRSDWANYGVPDFWATPVEFIVNGGDCECYAASKFLALLEGGWQPGDLYLATGTLPSGEDHTVAMAAVHERGEDRWMVLDNRYPDVYPVEATMDFKPGFLMSDYQMWVYRETYEPMMPAAGH